MRLYIFFLAIIFSQVLSAQQSEIYSKVRIDLSNHSINELTKLGLETDHGHIHPGKHLVNVFSKSEIEKIRQSGIPYNIEVANVQHAYHNHQENNSLNTDSRGGGCDTDTGIYDYDTPVNYSEGSQGGYVTYEEFLAVLDELTAKFPNLITAKAEVGDIRTHEDRPIYWLKISDNPGIDEDEPEVLYTALHHAREPNSLSQLIFFMWYVLENYDNDEEIKFLLENTELYFIPMINPDGYVWNQTTNPDGAGFWRKNRWPDQFGEKKGVDLNRNYGYEWAFDDQGSSPDPNSNTFRGESAFSEPETQAVKLFCEEHEFQLALNYHTHGNLLIHPWGFNDQPTPEDESFKLMGRKLNVENNYRLGTGTETVGYIVNGDSDDYMYGEETEKNKIYTYTPEVGPAFWPQAGEIDQLNKSNVRMNINLGLLTHNLLDVIDQSPLVLVGTNNQLDFLVQKAGLADGTNIVTVTSDNTEIWNIDAAQSVTLDHLGTQNLEFQFDVDPALTSPVSVTFKVTTDYGNFQQTQELNKIISPTVLTSNLLDDISADDNFLSTGDWGITAEDFVSPSSSYTDSPLDDYDRNRDDHVIFSVPLDLTDAIIANLKFHTKWDIEADYDFAQIMAGTTSNIDEMMAMCGQYTNAGTNDQILGSPLYDGTQSDWVQEEISLEPFLGEPEVYIAFKFVSDGFVEGDGFYFDDLELDAIFDTDTDTDNYAYSASVALVPNPAKESFSIQLAGSFPETNNLNYQITDIAGRVLDAGDYQNGNTIDISNLPAGVLQVLLFADEEKLAVKKLVKQ